MDTIFHKIIRKEIPAKILYEDEEILAFEDINPASPVHVLVIPKKTIVSLAQIQDEDALLLGKMLLVINKLAKELSLSDNGYRVVINTGKDGGQTVFQLHMHLLGGRDLSWPPG